MGDADRLAARSGRSLNGKIDVVVAMLRSGGSNLTGLVALLTALFGLFALLLPGSFPHIATVQAMMFQIPELGLLSLAMAIPLISGGLNLAIIATTNQAALLMA
jgi:simple sugar transport system permease protein